MRGVEQRLVGGVGGAEGPDPEHCLLAQVVVDFAHLLGLERGLDGLRQGLGGGG